MPAGRPTSFSKEIADTICERLAEGESLRSMCEEEGMPDKKTVLRWLRNDEVFRTQYAGAREDQADALFDDILTIADDGQNDWMERHGDEGENIGWRENGEALRRSQLRIDARKWMASKLKPKKYGDKLDLNHSGAIDTIPDDTLNARLTDLLGKAGIGAAAGRTGSPKEDDEA